MKEGDHIDGDNPSPLQFSEYEIPNQANESFKNPALSFLLHICMDTDELGNIQYLQHFTPSSRNSSRP